MAADLHLPPVYHAMTTKSTPKKSIRRSLTPDRKRLLKTNHRNTCQLCHRQFPQESLTIHHIVPLSLGGTNHTSNLLVTCRPCHDRADAEALRKPHPKQSHPKTYLYCLCCRDYVSESKLVGGYCRGCRAAYGL